MGEMYNILGYKPWSMIRIQDCGHERHRDDRRLKVASIPIVYQGRRSLYGFSDAESQAMCMGWGTCCGW